MTEYICDNCNYRAPSLHSINRHICGQKCFGAEYTILKNVVVCELCKKESINKRFLEGHRCKKSESNCNVLKNVREEIKNEIKKLDKKIELLKKKYKEIE